MDAPSSDLLYAIIAMVAAISAALISTGRKSGRLEQATSSTAERVARKECSDHLRQIHDLERRVEDAERAEEECVKSLRQLIKMLTGDGK